LNPEIANTVGAGDVTQPAGSTEPPQVAWRRGPTGVGKERGGRTRGLPRNLRDPIVSAQAVPPSEGNEARRDGRSEVGALS